jgi:hypothetical protein
VASRIDHHAILALAMTIRGSLIAPMIPEDLDFDPIHQAVRDIAYCHDQATLGDWGEADKRWYTKEALGYLIHLVKLLDDNHPIYH